MLVSAVDQDIFEHPSHAGCVRPDHWRGACGQSSAELLYVFENTRARPINVGAILKDDINVGVAEHGRGPYSLDVRRGEQSRNNGIRDLVFNEAPRLPGAWGWHNHLPIRDVRHWVQ